MKRRPNAGPYVAAALIAQQAASLLKPESTCVTVVAALYSVTASILRFAIRFDRAAPNALSAANLTGDDVLTHVNGASES